MKDFLSDERFGSVADVLRYRAGRHPERRAFIFLGDGVSETRAMSYGELELHALCVASRLRERCAPGDRVLLLYPPGLDFIAAFFGCLSAGVVAVPAYPPRRNRMMSRLQSIVLDASPALVLSTGPVLQSVAAHDGVSPELAAIPWVATDADDGPVPAFDAAAFDRKRLALLQYTSGSTSAPKGVMVTHGNLLHNSECIRRSFELTPDSVGVSWLPGYHDMGLIDGILQPVYAGFPAYVMAPASFIEQPIRWLKAISNFRGTHSGGPNFAYALCADRTTPEQRDGLDLTCWSSAYNGAEPVHLRTLRRFEEIYTRHGFGRQFFYPCYGLAEGTLMVTGGTVAAEPVICAVETVHLEQHRVRPCAPSAEGARRLVGCGHAGCGTHVVIVDPVTLRACPADRVGEIWVRGESVAAGYWEQPQKTRETFGAYLAGTGEGPFLRTGDLGFIREGELFVTGRLKDMFVIRGNNHYPQDIELTAERSHPALRIGCAAAFTAAGEESEQLVVVLEVERAALRDLDVEGIAGAVRAAVTEEHDLGTYAVVFLSPGTIPKTSSGKIQRHACRTEFLNGGLREVGRSILPPAERATATPAPEDLSALAPAARRTLVMERLRRMTAQTLRVRLSPSEAERPLIELGIDSMTAVELLHRIQNEFGVVLSQTDLLGKASVESLARSVLKQLRELPSTPEPVIVHAGSMVEYPLSRGQQALWFMYRMAPSSAAYNVSFTARSRSTLYADLLRDAFRAVAARHPSLRTTFDSVDGVPVQRVLAEVEPDFTVIDATGWSRHDLETHLRSLVHRPFDLKAGPPVRMHLYSLGDGEHVVHLTAHHIIVDYWSLAILLDDLRTYYRAIVEGRRAVLPPVGWTPAHFVQWQLRTVDGPEGRRLWSYWSGQLDGTVSDAPLLTDRPRPPAQSFRGGTLDVRLDDGLVGGLRSLARTEGTTLYVVVLAALQVLLHHYTGEEEIVVGSSVSGRSRSELARMVGYVANQVVLRGHVRGMMSFRNLLVHLGKVVAGAIEHQDYPFSTLVERLRPDRDPGRSALFQVMFAYEKAFELTASTSDPFRFERICIQPETAQFDLTLTLVDGRDYLIVSWNYCRDLFERKTIERMSTHFLRLLESIVEPDVPIAMLTWQSAEDRLQTMEWGNARNRAGRPADGASLCVHRWFEAQVERTPDAPAVRGPEEGSSYSYDEVNARANCLAHHLRSLGITTEVPVGICMRRSAGMIIALLGVLKAGGAYVPLDPSQPRQRLLHMMNGSGLRVVLTESDILENVPVTGATRLATARSWQEYADGNAANPAVGISPDNLAYVIFTSGSTGVPKGVMVTHRALTSYLDWSVHEYVAAAGDGAPVISSISFDATITALFTPLLVGRCVTLLPELREIEALSEALRAGADFSLVKITPAQLDLLTSATAGKMAGGRIRTLVVGGEALAERTVDHWRACSPPVRIINEYGPTEAVVGCCTYEVREHRSLWGRVPIGTPIARAEIYLLDRHLRPVPVGSPGELYIGGIGLARGYANDPVLTAEKFVPHPFRAGMRLYRSGDRARYLPDGTLDFLGRIDDQIKIRGVRIEPGDVESVLCLHPAVRTALVILRHDDGREFLVAYVVLRPGMSDAIPDDLRDWTADRLPRVMVPSAFIVVDALPLTRHGKIDTRALPAPDRSPVTPGAAPVTEVESIIAAIWRETLRLDSVGVDENFFELGGHSLLAAEVHSALQKRLRRELPIVDLLQYPTIASLARHLSGTAKTSVDVASVHDRVRRRTEGSKRERTERVRQKDDRGLLPPIVPVDRGGPLPLSFAQEKFWSLERSVPGNWFSNLCTAIHISGPLDAGILQQVLNELLRRHEVLRTSFATIGECVVQIVGPPKPFPLVTVDFLDRHEREREELFFRHAIQEFHRPFDFALGSLWRVTLIRLAETEYVLLQTIHHIISDGWSLQQLNREIALLYQARYTGMPSPLADLAIHYADYAVWQRGAMDTHAMNAQLSYWMQRLQHGSFTPLTLPGSRVRPAAQSFRTSCRTIHLPGMTSDALKNIGYAEGCTPFMTLLSAFKMALYSLTGDENIRIGTIVANRNHAQIEEVIGLFLNTVLLRADLSGDPTLREVLRRVRTVVLEAYENQDIPFEEVVRCLERRGVERASVFQVLFLFDNAPPPTAHVCGLTMKALDVKKLVDARLTVTTFDIIITFTDGPEGLSGSLIYKNALFDEHVIDRVLGRFEDVVRRIVSDPDQHLTELMDITVPVDEATPES
jgi:amino acid adenylation domain-containing protein